MAVAIKLKRAYVAADKADGVRILVDRLWPRGVSKDEAKIDHWCKEAAPTAELRRWFDHDPARWKEFAQRYAQELSGKKEHLKALRALARENGATLVYAARDESHNHAIVLRNVMLGKKPVPNDVKANRSSKEPG